MDVLKIIYRQYLALTKRLRSVFFTWLVKHSCEKYESPLRVNGYSVVNKKTKLGKNVNFNGMVIEGEGYVVIGDNFHSGKECKMITQIHNYEGEFIPYDSTYVYKNIAIEDNVWFGDRVMILGGVVIGEGAIIQGGSVVVSDIPKCAIAGGHPAKVFKYRNIEHYDLLKRKKKFF